MSPVRAPIGRHLETLQKVIDDVIAPSARMSAGSVFSATPVPPRSWLRPRTPITTFGKAVCGLPLFG